MYRTRAERRHHAARSKARARRIVKQWALCSAGLLDDPQEQEEIAVRLRKNRCKCSCPMCGNERRHFGRKTIQERRQLDVQAQEDS